MGCNSIDISNSRLELRFKLRQGLRTCLGMHSPAAMAKARVKERHKTVQMSIELHSKFLKKLLADTIS